jgi:S-adenosylmethionine:tRNA ribosyltransferase-isomerase
MTRTGLRTADFDYALPAELIAQAPATRRDESRLMVVDRATGTIEHRAFRDLPSYLQRGDALVVNTTRVFKARLLGTRDGSGAPAEVLLLRDRGDGTWEAMVQPGAKLKPGRRVHVADGLEVEILGATGRGTRVVRPHAPGGLHAALDAYGHVPLPPYITRVDAPADADRYQTVFSREPGSVAAPTAGLHFTPALLGALEAAGVRRAEVLLHIGAGTFRPVEAEDPADHVMHEEWYDVPVATADLLNETRSRGGRVCAVGTTSLRTLESARGDDGRIRAGSGETRLFLRPPMPVRAVDLLVTNFHLPRSTLLMLVAAMAGLDLVMRAYAIAVRERYRFYSYGDAMLVR